MKIHILGAPGAGVTTLGKALAARLGVPHFDTDDFHWFTDDPLPYRRRRNPEHRLRLLREALDPLEHWVLSGSLCGWGDELIPRFDAVLWRWLPVEVRLARIREREIARYGIERLVDGGDLQRVFDTFLQWAAAYDENGTNARSRTQELKWLAALSCPVLELEENAPPAVLADTIEQWLAEGRIA